MNKNKFYILHKNCLDFSLTLDCGQSFRWRKNEDGTIHGVAFGKALTIEDKGDTAILYGTDEKEFNEIWKSYFDIDRDYEKICKKLSCDKYLAAAIKEYPGIRILRQDPWETLCSFIISQNNNIPRIKGIIDRLCTNLGDNLGNGDYSFPPPEKISQAGAEGLAPLRAGFRTKYILDAAEKVARGEIDFDKINNSAIEIGAEELKKIKGVGDKVAACTLLYGFGKVDAFPIDVWVKRILAEMYPKGLPECAKGIEGIAQQYLFHWRRQQAE
jgi:N-glycosylase/DNA lyase